MFSLRLKDIVLNCVTIIDYKPLEALERFLQKQSSLQGPQQCRPLDGSPPLTVEHGLAVAGTVFQEMGAIASGP